MIIIWMIMIIMIIIIMIILIVVITIIIVMIMILIIMILLIIIVIIITIVILVNIMVMIHRICPGCNDLQFARNVQCKRLLACVVIILVCVITIVVAIVMITSIVVTVFFGIVLIPHIAAYSRRLFHQRVLRDFKDTVYPLFESDTLFLGYTLVLFLIVQRFFESRDV